MRTMDRAHLERLAKHYDETDVSAEIERAVIDDEAVPEPMVTTSLRLPKSTMDAIRAAAASAGTRPTALMRDWLEERLVEQDRADELAMPVNAVAEIIGEIYRRLGQPTRRSPVLTTIYAPPQHKRRVAGRRHEDEAT